MSRKLPQQRRLDLVYNLEQLFTEELTVPTKNIIGVGTVGHWGHVPPLVSRRGAQGRTKTSCNALRKIRPTPTVIL